MPSNRDKYEEAIGMVNRALRAQSEGALENAVALYRRSIEIMPTAEGHTYLGWALSYMGRLDEAIAHCHQAIELDPDFGNSYNDIGVYLMQQGQLDEAVPWLEKAKRAPRYEPRQFPYMNLARIHATRGQLMKAIEELSNALVLAPGDEVLQREIEELRNKLN